METGVSVKVQFESSVNHREALSTLSGVFTKGLRRIDETRDDEGSSLRVSVGVSWSKLGPREEEAGCCSKPYSHSDYSPTCPLSAPGCSTRSTRTTSMRRSGPS